MKRKIIIDGDVAYVPLTQGFTAIIDAADVHLVERWNWCVQLSWGTKYAYRKQWIAGKKCNVMMHRAILSVGDPAVPIDHHDGDGLNNRRVNLRPCSPSENARNRGAQKNSASGLKGVSKSGKKWRAEICIAGAKRHLGQFDTPYDAYAAYCAAAADLHGEFARVA
ncbi:AP2 domain-containing protein [Bradyrhizobium lablabi]|uniref:AP2 domain-containing protein n=1 Tax=Bradyrhizobium lablabi TaxID=722472 RepID=A0A1M6LD71_9BRAD|nr:HNH endonuclease [Bradyrhizobium lablabi]SHJ69136.1 AP2 domain-containing protein [Bradyrhizobium lablabi]